MSSAASWAGVASPSMTAPIAARASSRVSVPPSTTVARAARARASLIGAVARRSARPAVAKDPVASSSREASPFPGQAEEVGEQVRALRASARISGWNWTPSSGSATWRMPMTTRSTSLIAVTRSSAGSVAGSTASEW